MNADIENPGGEKPIEKTPEPVPEAPAPLENSVVFDADEREAQEDDDEDEKRAAETEEGEVPASIPMKDMVKDKKYKIWVYKENQVVTSMDTMPDRPINGHFVDASGVIVDDKKKAHGFAADSEGDWRPPVHFSQCSQPVLIFPFHLATATGASFLRGKKWNIQVNKEGKGSLTPLPLYTEERTPLTKLMGCSPVSLGPRVARTNLRAELETTDEPDEKSNNKEEAQITAAIEARRVR